ncbi:hypothetical protein D9M68_888250 [compost metagenome]
MPPLRAVATSMLESPTNSARSLLMPNCFRQSVIPAGLGFFTGKVSPLMTRSNRGAIWCASSTVWV